MLFSIARAPEPETDFKSARGRTSEGIPIKFKTGEKTCDIKSKIPDALTIDTATTSPTRVGSIEKQDAAPRFAPTKKVSKTGIFFIRANKRIDMNTKGKINAVKFASSLHRVWHR